MNWYVVYTKSHSEKKTFNTLQEMGYEVFLPTIKTMRQWSDRKKKIEQPLFPGYLFVKTTPINFIQILNIEGVVHFVRFGDNVAKVKDQDILNIKIMINKTEKVIIENKTYSKGQMIKITEGMFAGYQGLVEYHKSKNILIVSLLELHMSVKVEIPADFVNAVSK